MAQKGGQAQAIGRSRSGRTTKFHALSDHLRRPCAIVLTGGDVHDIKAAPDVLAIAPPMRASIADKANHGDACRHLVRTSGAKPVGPLKSNRIKRGRLNRALYKTGTPSSAASAG